MVRTLSTIIYTLSRFGATNVNYPYRVSVTTNANYPYPSGHRIIVVELGQ